MSKKTALIIAFLAALTITLILISTTSNSSQKQYSQMVSVTPTPPAHTTLSFATPNQILTTTTGTTTIEIDTKDNIATAVQLELSFDPKALTNVTVQPAGFFQNPFVLLNTKSEGRATYAFGISPNTSGKMGKGILATITFQSLMKSGESTKLEIMPKSLVTAEKEKLSVLKVSPGMTLTIQQQ